MSQRIAFRLYVKPEMLDEYMRRHDPVWPEMLEEIAASGRRNYSIFHVGNGELVGFYEVDDDAAAQAYLANSEIAAKWEADMGRFFVAQRSEEHTSELQSRENLVCRLLLEKK